MKRLRLPAATSAIAEQGLNGATNFALVSLLARSSSSSEFGRHALVLLVIQAAILVERGLAGGLMLASRSIGGERSREESATHLAAGALAALTAVAAGSTAALLSLGSRVSILWFAAAFLTVYGDYWRYRVLSVAGFGRAITAALVWVGVMVAVWGAGRPAFGEGAELTLVAYGPGAIGSTLILWSSRTGTSAWGVGAALDTYRGLIDRVHTMFLEQIGLATALVGFASVSLFFTLDEVAQVRVSQAIVAPLAVMIQGSMSFATVRATKLALGDDRRAFRGLARSVNAGALASGFVWLAVIWLGGSFLGPRLFGDAWGRASVLPLLLTLMTVLYGATVGTSSALLGLGANRLLRRLRVGTSVSYMVGQTLGALVGGAVGFGWGGVLVSAAIVPIWLVVGEFVYGSGWPYVSRTAR